MTEIDPAPESTIPEIPALPERSILGVSVRTAMVLLVFVVAFTTVMALTYQSTIDPIEASTQKEKLALIGEVLPAGSYDNTLLDDWVELPPTAALGLTDVRRIYRARQGGAPVALVLEAAATDGYSGRIGLLLAVRVSGELAAVRVTEHRETPGLGDYIDLKKDKQKTRPWITQFSGLNLDAVTPAKWRVKKDGGRFEQRAGATISARAVTNASGRALAWAKLNRDRVFAAASGTRLN
jgi:electron transport complex protein RnfG